MKNAGSQLMKNMKWIGLVASLALPLLSGYAQAPGAPEQAQAAVPVDLSPGAAEVVRLASSGVGDDVVLAYIQNSQAPFSLSADNVLYLKDVGLSPQVTSAMLSHDSALRGQAQQYAPAAPAPVGPPPVAPMAPAPAAQPPQVIAPPPAYVTSAPADVGYFYNDLSPYGTWVSLEGYGWCWQPRAVMVSRTWRPYCDGGHWVYTDAGWFWQSDYSWGWAPFHYGRWYMHPSCGWVWTPDRVWGPAWVTWRTSGDACGWAPLPPHAEFDVRLGWRFNGVSVGASFGFGLGFNAFAFVSFGDFCNRDLGHRRLPPERVTTIYNQTTIINNYQVHNNTIVNRGVPIERVSTASRVPVPRATVRDWRGGPDRMPSRSATVVYRPELKAPTRPVSMTAQKLDDRHAVIQHAPIAPVRTSQPSTLSRSGSAPIATPRQPAAAAPKASTWSSGAKPSSASQYQPAPRNSQPAPTPATPKASSWSSGAKPNSAPQNQSAPRTYQPAPRAPSAVTPVRQPEQGKQPTSSTPGYNNSRATQSTPAAKQTPSEGRNSPKYYPKGYYQSSETRSRPSADQGRSGSASSPANSPESGSKRN